MLVPLSDRVIFDHIIGIYQLLADDTCHFLAADFDEADWQEDAKAFVQSCDELGVPVALEISRSGNGAHARIFFGGSAPAREARRLGTAIISHTCSRTRQLNLRSYDRLFPNQDSLPKGGFGNLIALPLQKTPRENGFSVFVDAQLRPYPDQWAFLMSIRPMQPQDIEPTIKHSSKGEDFTNPICDMQAMERRSTLKELLQNARSAFHTLLRILLEHKDILFDWKLVSCGNGGPSTDANATERRAHEKSLKQSRTTNCPCFCCSARWFRLHAPGTCQTIRLCPQQLRTTGAR